MRFAFRLAAISIALVSVSTAAEDLKSVLDRINTAGAAFKSMSATLVNTEHTAILNEDMSKTGTIRMVRKSNNLSFLAEFTKPDPSAVYFQNQTIRIYYPKIATVHEYKAGKYKKLMEQLLLLGFGSSSKDLTNTYNIKLVGAESIEGEATMQLELIPKDKEALQYVSRIGLWINAQGYPKRQRIYEPSGNHRTYTYSNVKLNQGLTEADVKLKLPDNVKVEHPGQ